MKKCSICNKNPAVVFATKYEGGKSEMKAICIPCAKKLGIPIMDQLMQQTGMTEEEVESFLEEMYDGLDGFYEGMDFDDIGDEDPIMNLFNKSLSFMKGNNPEDRDERINERVRESSKMKKSRKRRKNLDLYGINLTQRAKEGQVDKIIGRDREMDRVVQILNRRTKNNPILIGEPGVGKTAIAEGLAVRIVGKQVPAKLFDTEVYLLDLTAVVAGTQFRGQFEGRMKAIIEEARDHGNVILVIDEVHNIMGAGEVHGGVMNAANILKPALARGEIQVIGATTLEEYRKHIEKDSALERRFQPIIVEEPTVEETIEILKGIKNYYEEYHSVIITDEVIEAATKLSARYITDRYLPDKAIDVIDEAGSRANLNNRGLIEIEKLNEELEEIREVHRKLAQAGEYEVAAQYKVDECIIIDKINKLKESSAVVEITEDDIAHVIESWTNIPIQRITAEEAKTLLNLEEKLHERLIGQREAVKALARAIRRSRSGFKTQKRPASFIFVGPTGVGKTELVKVLASELFGSEDAMIRVDMSEYMEKHTVSKLIGAPPGYVGYDEGGQLTEKVRRRPYSVILLDEIEKAHPDVFNMLLQILEDGRLTDNQGRTTHFENTIIIMTSNAGSHIKTSNIGFGRDRYDEMEVRVKEILRDLFRPEFLNRIDEIIVFDKLNKEELYQIIDLMLKEIKDELKERNIVLEVSKEVKDFILEKGYDEKYGARPLRRAIQRYIEDEIAEQFLLGNFKEGDHIKLDLDNGKIILTV